MSRLVIFIATQMFTAGALLGPVYHHVPYMGVSRAGSRTCQQRWWQAENKHHKGVRAGKAFLPNR